MEDELMEGGTERDVLEEPAEQTENTQQPDAATAQPDGRFTLEEAVQQLRGLGLDIGPRAQQPAPEPEDCIPGTSRVKPKDWDLLDEIQQHELIAHAIRHEESIRVNDMVDRRTRPLVETMVRKEVLDLVPANARDGAAAPLARLVKGLTTEQLSSMDADGKQLLADAAFGQAMRSGAVRKPTFDTSPASGQDAAYSRMVETLVKTGISRKEAQRLAGGLR